MTEATHPHLRPVLDPADRQGTGRWRLAGGPLTFSGVEVLRRGDNGLSVEPLPDPESIPGFDRLIRPRPTLPGLSGPGPWIAGILNVTPDSFSDGGLHDAAETAIAHGRAMLAAGADIIDVGGESTRPGAAAVPLEQEIDRVLPVIRALAADGAVLSIDTRKAAVMRAAVEAGASIVNDVSALAFDPDAIATVASLRVPAILMHSRGTPETMGGLKRYYAMALTICEELAERITACRAGGIAEERLLIDPGIGFAKGPEENLWLMKNMALLHGLGVPVMIGTSRKSFIGKLAGVDDPRARAPGSLSSALWAVSQGAQYVRVHDVAETRQAMTIWNAIAGAEYLHA